MDHKVGITVNCRPYEYLKGIMEIIRIGSDKGENDNAVIPSEGWDNTPLIMPVTGNAEVHSMYYILQRYLFLALSKSCVLPENFNNPEKCDTTVFFTLNRALNISGVF